MEPGFAEILLFLVAGGLLYLALTPVRRWLVPVLTRFFRALSQDKKSGVRPVIDITNDIRRGRPPGDRRPDS